MEIKPITAAELARDVYRVREPIELKRFLSNKIFAPDPKSKTMLKAEVGGRLITVTDGFAVCARGGKGYEHDLFLIFRGTERLADWISNLRLGNERSVTGLPVHIGFNHAFTSMLTQLRTFISTNLKGVNRIHCIGHSLGGAVATLAADWVKSHTSLRIMLYTFGAPRVGFEFFSKQLTRKLKISNIYRVYHDSDPVPMVPVYPYSHTPLPGYGYSFVTGQILSPALHKVDSYVNSARNKEWDKIMYSAPLSSNEQLIQQWLISDKPISPLNPKTWEFIDVSLQWVLKGIMVGALDTLQSHAMSLSTLADRIALILHKGIDLAKDTGIWVLRVMRKMMQALGMKVVDSVEQLTRAFMRTILERLMRKMAEAAAQALRGIIG